MDSALKDCWQSNLIKACFVRKELRNKLSWRDHSGKSLPAVEKELEKVSHELIFENDVLFSEWHRYARKKEIRVLLSGVEPKTFRLLVRLFYH